MKPFCSSVDAGSAARNLEGVNGLAILLAEDSRDQQLLVRMYLRGTPHTVAIVEDGLAAVDAFGSTSVDLILMDIQMPGMDGLTAAKRIRSLEAQRHSNPVPIIALSANDRPEDVALSRESGCNIHVSKPLSMGTLLAVLDQVTRARVSQSEGPLSESTNKAPQVSERFEQMRTRYLGTRRAEATLLAELLDACDFERIQRLAHNLKGTAGAYGFPLLTSVGLFIETAAKARDAVAVRNHLNELTRMLVCTSDKYVEEE